MPYAVSDLPDEWRSTPDTRGAHARFGTFKRLVGQNIPNIFAFAYWRGSSTSGDSGAATDEVAGTGWSVTEIIKGIIWQLRKLHSDYEEHKLQQRDLALQNTAHAAATLQSFTQVRGILDALKAELQDLRAAGIETMRSEVVHGARLAALSLSIDEVRAGQIHLQRQLDAQVAEQHTDSVEEDFADRLATVETAQHEHGRVVTRVEQESDRTLQVILRVNQLESDVNMVLLPYTHCHGAPA
jgi:hypothetical protein